MKVLILGGNRFFGRHLVEQLIDHGADVTLLNRGNMDDGFADRVHRLKADRKSAASLENALKGNSWDLVYDQVCFTAEDAREACRLFRGKTKRYVVTSTESVYDGGENQTEDRFDPTTYQFNSEARPDVNYQAAKRQMEAIISRNAEFEVAIVRPSLVVGIDDYTGRLKWHVDRIKNGQSLYFPALDMKSDFIRSDQAGLALFKIGVSNRAGAVNCTTPGAISLRELVKMCEVEVGREAKIASSEDNDNHSPYGGRATKTMDTTLLQRLGIHLQTSREWMGDLIREIAR
jgi:nucleoside-diphosphate-sugar epimerase